MIDDHSLKRNFLLDRPHPTMASNDEMGVVNKNKRHRKDKRMYLYLFAEMYRLHYASLGYGRH